jgi:predicted nuclease of predicted toxin-antitoxin system
MPGIIVFPVLKKHRAFAAAVRVLCAPESPFGYWSKPDNRGLQKPIYSNLTPLCGQRISSMPGPITVEIRKKLTQKYLKMRQIKLYGNENFDVQVIVFLRELGYDVLTAKEAGQANQRIPDDEVLQFAGTENRALLTFNRKDFFRLHKNTPNHAGIIACTYDNNYYGLAQRIDKAIGEEGIIAGKLLRIYRPNT